MQESLPYPTLALSRLAVRYGVTILEYRYRTKRSGCSIAGYLTVLDLHVFKMTRAMSANSMGLDKNSFTPASSARCRSSGRTPAVSAITGK